MNSKLQKISEYYKENGLNGTIKKVYRYISFKVQVKRFNNHSIYRVPKSESRKYCIKGKKQNIYIYQYAILQ